MAAGIPKDVRDFYGALTDLIRDSGQDAKAAQIMYEITRMHDIASTHRIYLNDPPHCRVKLRCSEPRNAFLASRS